MKGTNAMEIIRHDNAEGPYVVWQNYGCEGWKPTSYTSLREAVLDQKYQSEFVVTKIVEFRILELENSAG